MAEEGTPVRALQGTFIAQFQKIASGGGGGGCPDKVFSQRAVRIPLGIHLDPFLQHTPALNNLEELGWALQG